MDRRRIDGVFLISWITEGVQELPKERNPKDPENISLPSIPNPALVQEAEGRVRQAGGRPQEAGRGP